MPKLICPHCGKMLTRTEKTYICPDGHSYDISKSGYVNLLPPTAGGKRHGDDKLMITARRDFLNRGYYDPLSELISQIVTELSPDKCDIADMGCGECKYTIDILNALNRVGKKSDIVGIDISKDALIYAGKRTKDITLAAASCANIPLSDNSIDILLNIFSPFMRDEYWRVLKSGGKLIRVFPLKRHLWELKEIIYDVPYENALSDMAEEGFTIIDSRELCYDIILSSHDDITALFKMTPYYYKTGVDDQKKLERITELKTRIEFGLTVYEKSYA